MRVRSLLPIRYRRVNGVLDLSSIEAGMLSMETRLVNLRHLLLDVAEIISATAKRPQGKGSGDLTLRLIVSESIPTGDVLADETHLRQVRSICRAAIPTHY